MGLSRRVIVSGILTLPFWTLLISAGLPSAGAETNNQELVAADILKRVAGVYSKCRSYSDTGTVTTTYTEMGNTNESTKVFKTAFVRPARFRFEYSDKGADALQRRRIIWRQGKQLQEWLSTGARASKPTSLGEAVARATGVSAGAAHSIPALLLPDEIRGTLLTEMDRAERIDDSRFGSAACFRVRGEGGEGPVTVWIDKSTFLVRRIEDQIKSDKFRIQTTTTYNPAVDTAVTDEALEFNEPGSKSSN